MEGLEYLEYLECSTPELGDFVRLADKYSRENKTENDYK